MTSCGLVCRVFQSAVQKTLPRIDFLFFQKSEIIPLQKVLKALISQQCLKRTSGRSSGVEHNLAKVGVEGSNPFARSSFLPENQRFEAKANRSWPGDKGLPRSLCLHIVSNFPEGRA